MNMPFRKKQEAPQIELTTAQQMLDNIFDACKLEHNTVPLEVLSSYSNYRKERYSLQKTVLIVMMALFCFLPVLFIPAQITITENATNQTLRAEISTLLPVRRINAVINDRNVPIYETSSHSYVIQPSTNGRMTVSVTLMNQQTTTIEYDIDLVDIDVPRVVASTTDDHCVYLTVQDEGSGINYDGVYLMTNDGDYQDPVSCDPETGVIAILYPTEITHVYVPDQMGNFLHLVLTPQ